MHIDTRKYLTPYLLTQCSHNILTSCAGGRHIMPPPLQVDLWSFDLESGVRVTCDVGYLCANFSLPRPLCSRLRPDVRNRQIDVRQTSDAHHRLMPPAMGAGHNNADAHCQLHPSFFFLLLTAITRKVTQLRHREMKLEDDVLSQSHAFAVSHCLKSKQSQIVIA